MPRRRRARLSVIPEFNRDGLLPPGRYPATVAEVESRLVERFPTSRTRKDLFASWRERRSSLRPLVGDWREWVDGSFTTAKQDPSDVDVVVLVDGIKMTTLSADEQAEVRRLTSGSAPKLEFGCDSYIVEEFPDGHPAHTSYLAARGYWDRWWSRERSGTDKGYLDVGDTP